MPIFDPIPNKLQTPRLIGGVSFDGSANINLPGVNTPGNQDTSGRAAVATNADYATNAGTAAACSGNADTASQVYQNSAGPNTSYRFLLGLANNENGVVYNGAGIEYSVATATATMNITGNAGTATTAGACSGNALYASNVFQGMDPIAGTYRLLLGNSNSAAGPVYNLSTLFFNSTTGTIQGANISGNAETVTNGVYQNVSYPNPEFVSSLSASKLSSGTVPVDRLSGTYNISISGNASTAGKLTSTVGGAPAYAARAWVSFNGTGTPAIRGAGNVSSITDIGVGRYFVNFSTSMQDNNYSVSTHSTYTTSGPTLGTLFPFLNGSTRQAPATNGFYLSCQNFAGGLFDDEYITLSVHR